MNNFNFNIEELRADHQSALNAAEDLGLTKSIDYSRPLNEYATIQDIISFLLANDTSKHIYTKDLQKGGIAVQDCMQKYLANPALSSGIFKEALKTPLHFAFALDEDKKKLEKLQGEKPHFKLGEFLHQAVLEPAKFNRVIVEPKYSLTSKEGVQKGIDFWERTIEELETIVNENGEKKSAQEILTIANDAVEKQGLILEKQDGKKWYLRVLKDLSGLDAVTEEQYLKIQILKKHIDNYGDGIINRLVKRSKREISMYYREPSTGLEVKIRPDALQFSENIGVNAIISVKSSAIEDLRAFYYQAAKLHYDLSEGMYQEVASAVSGRDFNCTITIMLQTVPPFSVAVLVWSAEDIETGKYKYKTALQTAKDALQHQSFMGYDAFAEASHFGLIDMQLPQWNGKGFLPIKLLNTDNI